MTPGQLTSLRAACFADSTAAAFFPLGDTAGLRAYLNGPAGVNAWNTAAPVRAVVDAIDWSKYTANDAVDDAALALDLTAQRRLVRVLYLQTKQMNLQLMLQGRESVNASLVNLRAGLRDATINCPSGTNGANTSPGGASGVSVLSACVRPATKAEVMLAAPSQANDTTGTVTARVLTFEGEVSDVDAARIVFKDDGTIWTQGG